MPRKSPIQIIHETDDVRTAERFVGVLCLMEFYVLFIYYGASIWDSDEALWGGPGDVTLFHRSVRFVPFVCTTILFLCGRALWRGGRRRDLWLLLGICGPIVTLFAEAQTAEILGVGNHPAPDDVVGAAETLSLEKLLYFCQMVCFHLPLWVTLLVLYLTTGKDGKWLNGEKAPWVYCAAAYSLAMIMAVVFQQSIVGSTFDNAMQPFSNIWGAQYVIHFVDGAVLLATAILLFRGLRYARTTALITATLNVVAVGFNWFVLAWLVNIATESLLRHIPFSTPVERPYTYTQHDFMWLFVLPVHYVLPWLLIAMYAWRVPMRKPTDDGTPFPRRLCGHCRYNLFGCEAELCPECGSRLSAV